MRHEIILIGPIGAGKSTVGRLLAQSLGVRQWSMDQLRWGYYREIGFNEQTQRRIAEREGFGGVHTYWKPFEAHAVERILEDCRDCVIDLGAGHSVYEDPALFDRVRRALAPFRNVVLLLPSADADESIQVLRQRNPIETGAFDVHEHFVGHPSNRALARFTVYTAGRSPEQTRDEVIDSLGLRPNRSVSRTG